MLSLFHEEKKTQTIVCYCFLNSSWEGEGVNEIGKEKGTDIVRVKVNAKYFRPTEVVR